MRPRGSVVPDRSRDISRVRAAKLELLGQAALTYEECRGTTFDAGSLTALIDAARDYARAVRAKRLPGVSHRREEEVA